MEDRLTKFPNSLLYWRPSAITATAEQTNHPLNQQAHNLIRKARALELPPDQIPLVLQPASLAIPEGKEDGEEAQALDAGLRSDPAEVLALLERELPDGLPESPQEAAEEILRALKPLDPNRDLR